MKSEGPSASHSGATVVLPVSWLSSGTIPPPNSATSVKVCASPPRLIASSVWPTRASTFPGENRHDCTVPFSVRWAMNVSNDSPPDRVHVPAPSTASKLAGSQLSSIWIRRTPSSAPETPPRAALAVVGSGRLIRPASEHAASRVVNDRAASDAGLRGMAALSPPSPLPPQTRVDGTIPEPPDVGLLPCHVTRCGRQHKARPHVDRHLQLSDRSRAPAVPPSTDQQCRAQSREEAGIGADARATAVVVGE